jgi:hypothetical protein
MRPCASIQHQSIFSISLRGGLPGLQATFPASLCCKKPGTGLAGVNQVGRKTSPFPLCLHCLEVGGDPDARGLSCRDGEPWEKGLGSPRAGHQPTNVLPQVVEEAFSLSGRKWTDQLGGKDRGGRWGAPGVML